LRGSFSLNEETIDEQVGEVLPGVYALGYLREKTFIIQHISRSDTDVHARLKEHIGKYDRFKFEYYESPEAAFFKECELYHEFRGPEGELDNKRHPEKPKGATRSCPRCNVIKSQDTDQTIQEISSRRRQIRDRISPKMESRQELTQLRDNSC
jgi:hypothetical protein